MRSAKPCSFAGDELVRLFLRGGEAASAACPAAGDDHRVVGVVVQAEEAEIADRAEPGCAQVGGDVVVSGSGDVVGAAAPGGRAPDQVALLVIVSRVMV